MRHSQVSLTLLLVLTSLSLTGCMHKSQTPRASIQIPISCIPKDKPVIVENCDLSTSPPNCKGPISVIYRSGCEIVRPPERHQ